MGSNKKTQQDKDDVCSERPEIALLIESLTEAQRLANELKAYRRLDRSSSSMDPLPTLPAGGGAGALPALVEGISESLSRAIMLLLQSQSTGFPAPAPALARRGGGGYKRRAQLSQGCRKELRSRMDDGYSWRKYGQKQIFAAKYPRSYFRCKHKFEQLCPATRQVQRSEEDPSMLEITYIGDHTCTQQQQAAVTTLDDLDHPNSSQQHPSAMVGTASNTSIVKHEDAPSPSTEKFRRDHQAPADHDDGAPVHRLDLDGAFSYLTESDLQMALELGGHGDDVLYDIARRCYTNTYRYDTAAAAAAAGDEYVDDELVAAASSFGGFTSTSTAATVWELISSNNACTDI